VSTYPNAYTPALTYRPNWGGREEERIVWLAEGLLAEGKITVLDGDPGVGKTTVWTYWAARMGLGEPLVPGAPANPPGSVLVFNGEDAVEDTLLPRFRLQGGDKTKMNSISIKPDGSPFLIPNDLFDLEALIETLGIKLVIFDPIFSFVDADMMKSQQTRKALIQLNDVLQRTRCACLMLRHLNKNHQSSEAMYRGEGSIAINAVARVVLQSGFHPADSKLRVIANTKTNIGLGTNSITYRIDEVEGEQHGRLSWEGTANLSANQLLSPSNRADVEEREDLWFWAAAQLPITVKEMEKRCKDSGMSIASVKEVLKQRGIKAKPRGSGGEWEYRSTPRLDEIGVLECVGCGGPRFKGQAVCPTCGAMPTIIRRTQ
jgi:putative DNA primase/helicase